jgi:hypothetical protein
VPSRLLTNREESSRNIDKQVVRIAKATPGPSTTAKAEKPLIGNFSTGYQQVDSRMATSSNKITQATLRQRLVTQANKVVSTIDSAVLQRSLDL